MGERELADVACGQPAAVDVASSHVARLSELMTLHYPQYGVEYRKIPLDASLGADSRSREGSVERFRCGIDLFGLPIETFDVHSDWEAAKEAVARSCVFIMEEFLRLVQGRSADPMFGKIFQQMSEAMAAYQPPPSRRADIEEIKMAMGHEKIVSAEDRQPAEEATQEVLGPLLDSMVTKVNNPVLQPPEEYPVDTHLHPSASPNSLDEVHRGASPAASTGAVSDASPKQRTADLAPSWAPHPLSLLMHHYQKRSNAVKEPVITEFQGNTSYWGAHGEYHGFQVAIKAVYKRKSDAKYEAARRLYLLVMPDDPSIPMRRPDIGDADPEAKDVVIASSVSMIPVEPAAAQPVPKTILLNHGVGSGAIDEYLKDLPKEPMTLAPLSDKTFVSILNEYCQQAHISPPDYRELTVNLSLTTSYCMRVESFDGLAFMSYVFIRKKDAKEDCAMRIVAHLLDKGVLDATGKIKGSGRFGVHERPAPLHHRHHRPLFSAALSPFAMAPPLCVPSKRPSDLSRSSGLGPSEPSSSPPSLHPQMAAYHQMMALAMMHQGVPPPGAPPSGHHFPWPPMPPPFVLSPHPNVIPPPGHPMAPFPFMPPMPPPANPSHHWNPTVTHPTSGTERCSRERMDRSSRSDTERSGSP